MLNNIYTYIYIMMYKWGINHVVATHLQMPTSFAQLRQWGLESHGEVGAPGGT